MSQLPPSHSPFASPPPFVRTKISPRLHDASIDSDDSSLDSSPSPSPPPSPPLDVPGAVRPLHKLSSLPRTISLPVLSVPPFAPPHPRIRHRLDAVAAAAAGAFGAARRRLRRWREASARLSEAEMRHAAAELALMKILTIGCTLFALFAVDAWLVANGSVKYDLVIYGIELFAFAVFALEWLILSLKEDGSLKSPPPPPPSSTPSTTSLTAR
jgi:hypothetical protein